MIPKAILFLLVFVVGIFWTGAGAGRYIDARFEVYALATSAIQSGVTPEKLYREALAAYYAGEYVWAEAMFDAITERAPVSLKSDLDFWRGECFFRLGRTERARQFFEAFLAQEPEGPRVELAKQRTSLLRE